jgi:transposase
MARITDMIQLSEILRRLRKGDGTNKIKRELGTHKTVIKRVRDLASAHGWLDPLAPLPDEQIIHEKYRTLFAAKERAHPLDAYKNDIKKWREARESFVVIRHKLNERLGNIVKDTALRDYVHREFPTLPQMVVRREVEFGVAELDFGYLGKTQDDAGRIRKTWFISVRFRASRHAYREKLFRTDMRTVIRATQNAFEYFGGVPLVLVIDNFKAAVTKAHMYDPTITKGFYEFAKHADFLISPCKPNSPEHKGGVESDVKYVKKNFLPILRDYEKQRGHDIIRSSLINERFEWWNTTVAMKRKIREEGDRTVADLFDGDFKHLRSLPETPYQIVEWTVVKVRNDWHVQFDTNYYSVPYQHRAKEAGIRISDSLIEVFIGHELVARHQRSHERGKRITVRDHGPEASIEYLEATRSFILKKAQTIGPKTHEVVSALLGDTVIDRSRSARGIVFLTKKYPPQRIEKACARAIFYAVPHYHNIKHILEKNLDMEALEPHVDAKGQLYFMFNRDRRQYN